MGNSLDKVKILTAFEGIRRVVDGADHREFASSNQWLKTFDGLGDLGVHVFDDRLVDTVGFALRLPRSREFQFADL